MGPNGDGNGTQHMEIIVRPDDFYADVLREAFGEALALEQRKWRKEFNQAKKEWKRELDATRAKADVVIAMLRAELAELGDNFTRRIDEQVRTRALRGPPGEPGYPGEKGEPGPMGRLPIAMLWAEGVTYEGEVRLFEGGCWQATCDTARPPSIGSDWAMLAAPGRDALTPRVRGTWKPDVKYRALDICAHNGSSFIARHDGPGPCPGDGWQILAMVGKRGAEGPRGERGPPGISGREGTGIADVFVDAQHYMLRIPFTDGTVGEINLRPMFEQFVLESRVT